MARATAGAHVISGLVLAATGVALLAFAAEHPYYTRVGPGPGFLPRWVGGLILASSLIYLTQVLRRREALSDEGLPDGAALVRIGAIIVILLASAPVYPVLGFRLTTTAMLFVFFNLTGVKGIREVLFHLALSLALSWFLYLVFFTWLNVQLPQGIW